MTGKERDKNAESLMITEEEVTIAEEGSRIMEVVIGVVNGVICRMTAQGNRISVPSVEG
ncbi:hypothetical protein A2U01_0107150 [Trifolium medium]|uniref:Uncharacterized protein n=1 Tax=Trifolium medium TaxID=97028 RepID=A0A392VFZ7_9FABA|nr:hypothetical protein [Trifolium medium]